MEIIDGNWIKERLSAARGSRAALAEATGLRPDQISKIIKGERKVQAREIPRILAFFGETAPSGFSESAAGYLEAAKPIAAGKPLEQLTAIACPDVSRPFYYRATRSEPLAGILKGDILIVTHGYNNAVGALVLLTIEGDAGEGQTELRRAFSPHLIALDMAQDSQAIAITDPLVAIIGTVAAVLRVPGLI